MKEEDIYTVVDLVYKLIPDVESPTDAVVEKYYDEMRKNIEYSCLSGTYYYAHLIAIAMIRRGVGVDEVYKLVNGSAPGLTVNKPSVLSFIRMMKDFGSLIRTRAHIAREIISAEEFVNRLNRVAAEASAGICSVLIAHNLFDPKDGSDSGVLEKIKIYLKALQDTYDEGIGNLEGNEDEAYQELRNGLDTVNKDLQYLNYYNNIDSLNIIEINDLRYGIESVVSNLILFVESGLLSVDAMSALANAKEGIDKKFMEYKK